MANFERIFNGKALKRFRAERKLSQMDVAGAIGIMPQAYARYEHGKTTPSVDIIMKIADTYGVSTDYLLGRSDVPNPLGVDESEMKEAFAARDILRQMQSLQLSMNRFGSRSGNAGQVLAK